MAVVQRSDGGGVSLEETGCREYLDAWFRWSVMCRFPGLGGERCVAKKNLAGGLPADDQMQPLSLGQDGGCFRLGESVCPDEHATTDLLRGQRPVPDSSIQRRCAEA